MASADPVANAVVAWKAAYKLRRDVISADAALSAFQVPTWKVLQLLDLAELVWPVLLGYCDESEEEDEAEEDENEDEEDNDEDDVKDDEEARKASHFLTESGTVVGIRFLDLLWRRAAKEPKVLVKLLWGAATDWCTPRVSEASDDEPITFAEVSNHLVLLAAAVVASNKLQKPALDIGNLSAFCLEKQALWITACHVTEETHQLFDRPLLRMWQQSLHKLQAIVGGKKASPNVSRVRLV